MLTRPPVQVLDLGLNNVAFLVHALRGAEADSVDVVTTEDKPRRAGLFILPGVGAFGAAMSSLRARGFKQPIWDHLASSGYLMRIYLGMQLLFDKSSESPGCPGLGLINGEVHRIPMQTGLRVAHVG